MIKKLKITVIALLLGFSTSFALTIDEVIAKHIEAMGGAEKLAGLKAVKMKASVDIGPNMKAPLTMIMVSDQSLRIEMEMQGMTMVQVADADSGWAINPFGGKKEAERLDKETVKQMLEQSNITGSLYNYKAKGNVVTLLGKEDMEGSEIYKIKVVKKNGDEETIFLDATSFLMLKKVSKHKMKDKEVSGEVIYSNYKKVDGIMFAFSMEEREVGASQGAPLSVDSIEVNPKIDASIFKMPAPTLDTKPATDGKK